MDLNQQFELVSITHRFPLRQDQPLKASGRDIVDFLVGQLHHPTKKRTQAWDDRRIFSIAFPFASSSTSLSR